ncbi:MAG: hypothetical protein ACRDKX_08235 [Solirubrobacterales bacterium]
MKAEAERAIGGETPDAPRESGEGATRRPWRTRAFGLDLEVSFPVPGLAAEASPRAASPTSLRLAPREDLRSAWRNASPVRISERCLEDGRRFTSIDVDPELGYLLYARDSGQFWLAADGTRIRCSPLRVPAWRWQRYLIGQVLPFASVLQGFEVFHASAVVIADKAVVFVGGAVAGKTTLAVSLALRGAGFLADDVVAVDASPAEIRVEPGAGVCNLRRDMAALLSPEQREQLGEVLGRDRESVRITVPRRVARLPLAAIYFLERTPKGSLAIERLAPVDPRLFLGSSFNLAIRTPERLARQLDLAARVATQAPSYRVALPGTLDPAALASSIERHAAGL